MNRIRQRTRAWMRAALVTLGSVGLAAAGILAQLGSVPLAQAQTPAGTAAALIPAPELDSPVAPVALYSDPLLAQTLAASTYSLEIIQLRQFLERNPGLKDQALVDAVERRPGMQAPAGDARGSEAFGRRHPVDHGLG
jgi:hypothetical protein